LQVCNLRFTTCLGMAHPAGFEPATPGTHRALASPVQNRAGERDRRRRAITRLRRGRIGRFQSLGCHATGAKTGVTLRTAAALPYWGRVGSDRVWPPNSRTGCGLVFR
jgi:hypothetical protein